MTPHERAQFWQQPLATWQASGQSANIQ